MNEEIKKFMTDFFDIEQKTEYEFCEVCGFTFTFKMEMQMLNEKITSAQIAPAGIIYEENDNYYFAPLDETVSPEEIIKEYGENYLLK